MMAENNPDIIVRTREAGNTRFFELLTDHGSLDATLHSITRWFGISGIQVDVDYRGRGIAKTLLRQALYIAETQDARLIYAAVVSRESIDAMRSVFGDGAVQVDEIGTYTPYGEPDRYDASAHLSLNL